MTVPLRLSDLVHRADPAAQAACDPACHLNYAELNLEIDAVAYDLIERGIKPGDRVGLLANPGTRFWSHFLGTVKTGAIWFGLNPKYKPAELSRAIEDTRPSLVQFDPALVDSDALTAMQKAHDCPISAWPDTYPTLLQSVEGEASFADRSDPDAPSLLVFTSGSSGRPKGALIGQRALIRAAEIRCAAWANGPFRTLANLPINHIGCVGDHGCTTLFSRGMLAFQPRYDAAGGLDLIEQERLNFFFQVPAQLEMAFAEQDKQPRDLSSIDLIAWSGGAASEVLVMDLDRRFPGRIATDYSSTESVGAITLTKPGVPAKQLIGMAGYPVPERPLSLSDVGEVLVPAQDIFLGYFENLEATNQAISGGQFHTGDIGAWHGSGNALKLVGRMSDMFKSGGYNVYPREIEIILEAHPSILRAAVVSRPDDRWGEVGIACVEVVQNQTLDPAALIASLKTQLANYKVPKSIEVFTALPLLPIGKVDKKALKALILLKTP
jgi:acyl-CoA synthetase (AMP-forming)/AMP-acid ligase II